MPISLATLVGFLLVISTVRPVEAQIKAQPFLSGLSTPLELVQDPSNPSVQYVVEQTGRIRVISGGVLQNASFLDLSAVVSVVSEQGLLGLAFPLDYAMSGRFYVDFTDGAGNTVVARFKRSSGNPLIADPASRLDLKWSSGLRVILQPAANHNGGHLAFGPDGFLYVALGDGGFGGDPGHRAQDPTLLLGKLLRIDVNVPDANPSGFVVPGTNPFPNATVPAALPEIWDFGLRNPWKFTFDDPALGGTGALVIADVGQGSFEEIDYEPAGTGGRNYGWRNREGAHPFSGALPPAFLPLTEPILEYDHTVGHSVTGGFVYRGSALRPEFNGRYFYADFVNQRVWSAALTIDPVTGEATAAAPVEHTAELGGSNAVGNVSAFGADAAGELYIVSYSLGAVLKIVDDPASPGGPVSSTHPLTITPPTGGSVLAAGIRCGALGTACTVPAFPRGITIGLEAIPAAGYRFTTWTGQDDCLDGGVTMNGPRTCGATFELGGSGPPGGGGGSPPPAPAPSGQPLLTVIKPAGGTVLGPGILCGTTGATCAIHYPAGITLVFEQQADAGFSFGGWSSECAGGVVTMNGPRTCTPTFVSAGSPPPPSPAPGPAPGPIGGLQRLTITTPAGGTIVGPGINCGRTGAACTIDYPSGIRLVLEQVSDPGFTFAGWSADCANGLVVMTTARACTPAFSGGPPSPGPVTPPVPAGFQTLTITRAIGGTVLGAGITCGDTGTACSIGFPSGIRIGLEAVPSPGFRFGGWTGAGCSSLVTLNAPLTCAATFMPAP